MISFRESFNIVLSNGSILHIEGEPEEIHELSFSTLCKGNRLRCVLRKGVLGKTRKGEKRVEFVMPFDELCRVVDMIKSYNGIK